MNHKITVEIDGVVAGWIDIEGTYLDFIGVDENFRGLGISIQLLEKLFAWMKQSRIRSLNFLDNNQPFWSAMKQKYPKNIFISPRGEGRIYAHV